MIFPSSHKIATVLLMLSLALVSAPQVLALELRVTPDGTVLFFQDGVLGDSTDDKREDEKDDDEQDDNEDEREVEAEHDEQDKPTTTQPLKTMSAPAGTRINVKSDGSLLRVGVAEEQVTPVSLPERSNKGSNKGSTKVKPFVRAEEVETRRVKADFPVTSTKSAANDSATIRQREEVKQNQENRLENMPEAAREEVKSRLEKVQEDRYGRQEEKLQLQSRINQDGEQELELETRNIRASLKGADFSYDPTTNAVIVITPSGQEHTLNHLPDQALERFQERITLKTQGEGETPNIEVETGDDGSVHYTAKGTANRKLFGLLNRSVDTKAYLNDETGEIVEVDQSSAGVFGKLLDVFTF